MYSMQALIQEVFCKKEINPEEGYEVQKKIWNKWLTGDLKKR